MSIEEFDHFIIADLGTIEVLRSDYRFVFVTFDNNIVEYNGKKLTLMGYITNSISNDKSNLDDYFNRFEKLALLVDTDVPYKQTF